MNNRSRIPSSRPRDSSRAPSQRGPTFVGYPPDPHDVLRTIGRHCAKAVEHADSLLTTLYITSNSMSESGLIDKIKQRDLKNLKSSEVSSVLMALMNSPIGHRLFPKASGLHHQDDEPVTDPEDE